MLIEQNLCTSKGEPLGIMLAELLFLQEGLKCLLKGLAWLIRIRRKLIIVA